MKKKSLESDANNKVEHAVCMKGSLIWNDYMKRVYVCIVFLQFKNKRRREEKRRTSAIQESEENRVVGTMEK